MTEGRDDDDLIKETTEKINSVTIKCRFSSEDHGFRYELKAIKDFNGRDVTIREFTGWYANFQEAVRECDRIIDDFR